MKVLASNRRARFDYQIGDKILAGLVLTGPEVKSAKLGQVSLKGSYVTIKNDEAWLINAHINPYKPARQPGYEPTVSRKLLLHRKQIEQLIAHKQDGLAIVPLALLLERSLIKLEVGIGRGKKRYDKRESIKQRQTQRDLERQFKR